MGNEPRTLRSKKARARLWYAAEGICPLCGDPILPIEWNADHKISWKVRPVTNMHEMQALCVGCNLKKGSK